MPRVLLLVACASLSMAALTGVSVKNCDLPFFLAGIPFILGASLPNGRIASAVIGCAALDDDGRFSGVVGSSW